jgi:hypothetical protein
MNHLPLEMKEEDMNILMAIKVKEQTSKKTLIRK